MKRKPSLVRPPAFPDDPRLRLSEAGLRGVVGATLTPDLAAAFAAAFAETLPPGPIAVGRDSRPSGPMLLEAVSAGLVGVGREVCDLGLATTPTVEIYGRMKETAGGIVVTASHNPVEWNALKLIGPGGFFIGRQEARDLRARYDAGISWRSWSGLGTQRRAPDAAEIHLGRVLAHVDVAKIRARKFRVVLDAVNGAGSFLTPTLLERLGCEVTPIHCDPERPFPHDPEPRPEHLGDLVRAVREKGADVGFAQDPDADRLALVAEGGRALSEEFTLVLVARHVLTIRGASPVVGNLSGSRALERVAEPFGAPVFRTPIGEIHVSRKMREVGAVIGGEGNGGVMYAPVHECRDSLTGIALVLEAMAASGKTLGGLADTVPRAVMKKAKTDLAAGVTVDATLAKVERAFGEKKPRVNREDGVLLEWGEGDSLAWIHARASNTEPILRYMAEASSEEETDAILARAIDAARRHS